MRKLLILALAATAAVPVIAQSVDGNSRAEPLAIQSTIPAARDIAYPGAMQLRVDATDTRQGIFKIEQEIPVAAAGPMVLLFPAWLPGNHAPRGQIEKLAGLTITANGKTIPWRRDAIDVYAFHIEVPRGAKSVTARFQFVSATESDQGRIIVTPEMMNPQWQSLSLYPAGYYVRQIPVDLTVTWPEGWEAATALRPKKKSGNVVSYERVTYETLVDSPAFAGKYFKAVPLSDRVTLNMVADAPENLAFSDDQLLAHKRLVTEAVSLFGSQQYDRYDFLLALTDKMGGIGIEHHRSSENGVNPEYFTDWAKGPGRRNLLPHEVTHSWNGKYRRPAGLFTPDYRTPMQGDLLWVYEGQTQFWGYILQARSGMVTKGDTLDALAVIAANLEIRKGRDWRALEDTTRDPIITARRPKGWTSWQRSEDYYNEGLMIWLEADGILRRESGGTKSMDDFAKAFFGGRDGDWGVVTYTFDDVAQTLNSIQPYDWSGFLQRRISETGNSAGMKAALEMGGYRLGWSDKPNAVIKQADDQGGRNLNWSIGLNVNKDGKVIEVIWDSPGFAAGLVTGTQIVAVNNRAFKPAVLSEGVDGTARKQKLELLVKNGDVYRTVTLDYVGGLRYPVLVKIGEGEGGLDRLLAPRTW